jgi:hypothetical protein
MVKEINMVSESIAFGMYMPGRWIKATILGVAVAAGLSAASGHFHDPLPITSSYAPPPACGLSDSPPASVYLTVEAKP